MKKLFSLLIVAIAIHPAFADQPPPLPDPICQAAIDEREGYGRLVFMFGDSISRGFALGAFEDGVSPLDLSTSHPLWAFRSIQSMANAALVENSRPERFAYCGDIDQATLDDMIANEIILPGDLVIFEDAGEVLVSPGAYYSKVFSLRVSAGYAGVESVFMSMFDYCAPTCPTAYQWDYEHAGGSLNSAIAMAATRTNNPATRDGFEIGAQFIDMNWVMDSWRNAALTAEGLEVIRGDLIHPNVWGQMMMARQYLAASGLLQFLVDVSDLQDLAAANYSALAYGSGTFTANDASNYVSALLGSP